MTLKEQIDAIIDEVDYTLSRVPYNDLDDTYRDAVNSRGALKVLTVLIEDYVTENVLRATS